MEAPPPFDLESLADQLVSVLNEIQDEMGHAQTGPTLTDSISAKRLARIAQSLCDGPERPIMLERLLKDHARVARWAAKMLETNAGRRDLKALLRIEMC